MRAIEARGLGVSFGDVKPLRGVDLAIDGPGIYGFLGVNGAGKTTTLRVLAGLLEPDHGEAFICGQPVGIRHVEPRRRVGWLPQHPSFPPWLRAREVLELAGELSGLGRREARGRAGELLERLGLSDAAARRVTGFSGGMRQRLGLAQALVGRPQVLLLDEPMSALDPIGRAEVADLLVELSSATTVFYSTHILDDVERVCESVAVLHHGRILLYEPTRRLLDRFRERTIELRVLGDPAGLAVAVPAWAESIEVPSPSPDGGDGLPVWIRCRDPEAAARSLPGWLANAGLGLMDLGWVQPSLESVFLKLLEQDDAQHPPGGLP
ncbi:MAG: ABC transporter ATP-binding protein [Pseudomonadota bacterium]